MNEPSAVNPVETPSFSVEAFWESPEGQDMISRIQSGEWSEDDADWILRQLGEPDSRGRVPTYEDVSKRIGHLMPRLRRIGVGIDSALGSWMSQDWKETTKQAVEEAEETAGGTPVLQDLGPLGTGLSLLWDTAVVGTYESLVEGVPEIIAGRESPGQLLDVTLIAMPAARFGLTFRAMSQPAIRAAAGAATGKMYKVRAPRKAVERAMREADPETRRMLEEAISKHRASNMRFARGQTSVEMVNLGFQNEELLLELFGEGVMRGVGKTGEIVLMPRDMQGDIGRGMVEGMEQTGRELGRAQGQPEGNGTAGTTSTPPPASATPPEDETPQSAQTQPQGGDPLAQITGQVPQQTGTGATGASTGGTGGTVTPGANTGIDVDPHAAIMGAHGIQAQPGTDTDGTETDSETTPEGGVDGQPETTPDTTTTPEGDGAPETPQMRTQRPNEYNVAGRVAYDFLSEIVLKEATLSEIEAHLQSEFPNLNQMPQFGPRGPDGKYDANREIWRRFNKFMTERGIEGGLGSPDGAIAKHQFDAILQSEIEASKSPPASPQSQATPDTATTPEAQPETEGAQPEPEAAPEAEIQPETQPETELIPEFPSSVTPILVDDSGSPSKSGAQKTFIFQEAPDIEAYLTKTDKGVRVTFDMPGYSHPGVELPFTGSLTNRDAAKLLEDYIRSPEFQNTAWGQLPDDPRLSMELDELTPSEIEAMEKLPELKTRQRFKDKITNSTDGVPMGMPVLDPGMRIKTHFQGHGAHDVYIESNEFEDFFADYEQRSASDDPDIRYTATFIPRKGKQQVAAIKLSNVGAVTGAEAASRALVNILPEKVFDDLTVNPEPDTPPLDKKGMPGNEPPPLPDKVGVELVGSPSSHPVQYNITDSDGNVVQGYSVEVRHFNLPPGHHTVVVSFPQHQDIPPLETTAMAETPEEAAVIGIQRLRQKKWGEGGIGGAAPLAATPVPEGESLFEEDLEPVITSKEKPFGKLTLNIEQKHAEKLHPDMSIYDFTARHAPQVYIMRRGMGDDMYYEVELRHHRRNAGRVMIYGNMSEKKAIREAIKKVEESGHEWKPLYKSGVFYDIDQVQNALDKRQFATTPAVERRARGTYTNLRNGHSVDVRGYTITSLKELAIIGQVFRNPHFEASRVIYLDADRNVLGHELVSVGLPASSKAVASSTIREGMEALGATHIIGLHNHPSGKTLFSEADKGVMRRLQTDFKDAYLGDVLIQGEWSYAVNEDWTKAMVPHERLNFTKEDLGWDPGPKPLDSGDAFQTEGVYVRPGDPIYRQDVDVESEQLRGQAQEIRKGLMGKGPGGAFYNIARLGKDLELGENWTTVFFMSYYNTVTRAMDYKDLHLMSPSQLQSFLDSESRRFGGYRTNVYVGKGDWYETREDVEKSVWGALKKAESIYHVETAWFEGLADNEGIYEYSPERQMLTDYGEYGAYGVMDAQVDTEVGADTGLTTETPKMKRFVKAARNALKSGLRFDALANYRNIFKRDAYAHGVSGLENPQAARELGVRSFVQAVINRFNAVSNINPNTPQRSRAQAHFEEQRDINEQMDGLEDDKGHWVSRTPRSRLNSAMLYLAARVANINRKDHVLTVDDYDGTLATFANNAKAGGVDTTTTDSWTRSLHQNVNRNTVDRILDANPYNLSTEYSGTRPTVILMNPVSETGAKIDEAMKLLAPGGRLVCAVRRRIGEGKGSPDPWKVTSEDEFKNKHTVRNISFDTAGQDFYDYYVIDKTIDTETGTGEEFTTFVEGIGKDMNSNLDKLFEAIDNRRNARPPVVEYGTEFKGVRPDEYAFADPLGRPRAAAGLQTMGGLVQGEAEGTATEAPMSAEDAQSQGLLKEAEPERRESAESHNGLQVRESEPGMAPSVMVRETPPSTPPDPNTPIGLAPRLKDTAQRATKSLGEQIAGKEGQGYVLRPRTGKQTLEKLGRTGVALVQSLMRVRHGGDKLTGRGENQLDDFFPKWKELVRDHAERTGQDLNSSSRDLNNMLINYQEGNLKTKPPPLIKEIADSVTAFYNENIVNPMLDMNKGILNQGLLFEAPEQWVDQGVLTDKYRRELEAGPANFDKFMRQAGAQARNKGRVHAVVRDKNTGKTLAVRIKGEVFMDLTTGTLQPLPGKVEYTMVDPFKEEYVADASVVDGTNPDYELIASRDPYRGKWRGDRARAKELWDQEITDNPLPDVVGEHFERMGIQLPEGVTFKFFSKGNLDQWSVRHEGVELFRIKRVMPTGERVIDSPVGKVKVPIEAHSFYDPFKGKLLVYDAMASRDPIFIKDGKAPVKLWEPEANYFPHIVHWQNYSVNDKHGWRYQNFLRLAEQLAKDPNHNLDEDAAKEYLRQQLANAKTRAYGNLEQLRKYNFPEYDKNFFQVWQSYLQRSSHRLEAIRQFGQNNDLLNTRLSEFISPDQIMGTMSAAERSVLRIRFGMGYHDFNIKNQADVEPFEDDRGQPNPIDPMDDKFAMMSPADWKALIDANIVRARNDGMYVPTAAGVNMLRQPAFLSGAIADGMYKMKVASDVVTNQLGWRQGDMLDEQFDEHLNNIRTWSGVVFLGRAWASNLGQTVNAALVYGPMNLLRAYRAYTKETDLMQAKEVGAFAIDVMHDFAGSSNLPRRVIRHMLGATPSYQVGDIGVKSFFPSRSAIESHGIRSMAWTPFYAIEKFNRASSALAARYYAVSQLKQMVANPTRSDTARARLLEVPHAQDLQGKLDAVMNIPNLTVTDVENAAGMLHDDIRQNSPHLYPVYDFMAEFMKHGADWTQHRVEAMDRGRPWTRNKIFLMLQHLQSFNIAQTKFIKDVVLREWRIMHTFMNERSPIEAMKNDKVAAAVGSVWFLSKVFALGSLAGLMPSIVGRISRFQVPEEEDFLPFQTLYKAGMYTYIGELMAQLYIRPRGRAPAEEALLGPTLGTVADMSRDPVKTAGRLARLPLMSPSVAQVMGWGEEEETGPAYVPGGGGLGSGGLSGGGGLTGGAGL